MKLFKLLLTILIFVALHRPSFAAVLFQDNFDDSDFNSVLQRWEVNRDTCVGDWRLSDGRIGITIDGPSPCQAELAPNDTIWSGWNNYVYEVDIILPENSGTDKNTAFRYSGPPNFDWYGLHFQVDSNGSNLILERVCYSPCQNSTRVPVTNGNTYRLKMIANNDHISTYIDGNLVIDIPHTQRGFNAGKIALRAGVGADIHTEVYFDNIIVSSIEEPTPTPTPTPPSNPVVILPGFLGSWCKGAITSGGECPGSWTALPELLDPYGALVESVRNAPEIDDNDVYVWYYDWRDKISVLASQFESYVNTTVLSGKPPGTKVNIVGHSYGGLVGTKYVQDHPDKVNKLITVGSPHQGAVKAYGAWGGGELWGFPIQERIVMRLLLAARQASFLTLKDVIRNDIPSLKEILPTFDYLVNANDQQIPESSLSQRNPQLSGQYADLPAIASLMTSITGLENVSDDTLLSIKVKSRNWIQESLGLWDDGAPDQLQYSSEGDTTVLRSSGKYDSASSTPEVSATHLGLVTETAGINAVLAALGSSATASRQEPTLDESQGHAILFLRSPATMSLQIAGRVYSDIDGLIILEDIGADIGTLTLTGTGIGNYHLDILQLTPGGDSTTTYAGAITPGEVQSFSLQLDPDRPTSSPLVDSQGNLWLRLASGKLDEASSIVNSLTGPARMKQLLRADIASISRSLSRAQSQVASPALGVRTVETAILSLHRLRVSINNFQQQGLDADSATLLRNLSRQSIELSQSAFAVFAQRANRNFPARQLNSLLSTSVRLEAQVHSRAAKATRGRPQAAWAIEQARLTKQVAESTLVNNSPLAYINSISTRLYLEESIKALR